MKWGVRRFQRKDGSLTPAGKKRAQAEQKPMSDEELSASVKRLALEKQYKSLSKEAAKPSKLEKTKKLVDATSTLANQAKSINRDMINSARKKEKLDLTKMTDQELRSRINRANLERQYSDLFAKEEVTLTKGQVFASKALDVGGGVLAVTGSALSIALAIRELRK